MKEILSVEEVVKRSQESFTSFSWEEYSADIPKQFKSSFDNSIGSFARELLGI